MTTQAQLTSEKEPHMLIPQHGISFADHPNVLLYQEDKIPRIEGEGHRRAVRQHGEAALVAAGLQYRNDVQDKQLHTDPLTGVANRLALSYELVKRHEEARKEKDFALLFIDLDNFKLANDTLGHEKGDALLVEVANKLNIKLRKGEFLARLSGDEFVAIVNPNNSGNSRRITNKRPENVVGDLKKRLSEEVSAAGKKVGAPFVGASIGVAFYDPEKSPDELLHEADQNMFFVKTAKGAAR